MISRCEKHGMLRGGNRTSPQLPKVSLCKNNGRGGREQPPPSSRIGAALGGGDEGGKKGLRLHAGYSMKRDSAEKGKARQERKKQT